MDVLPTIPGYTLLEPAGRGAMGAVYRATHEATGAPLAIKLLPPTANPRLEAFRQAEIRATAVLDHPSIVRIIDTGVEDDGNVWLALEWCGGGTLEQVCDWDTLYDATRQVLRGLAHAHSRHVLHRDIKPANLLMDDAGRWKIADFGVARIGQEQADALVGSPNFIAPEVVGRRVREQGPASDLYSLGATLWRVLTGRPLFDGSVEAVLAAHQQRPIPAFTPQWSVPDHVEAWLRGLLAKEPAARPASAAQALDLLERRRRPLPTGERATPRSPSDERFNDAGLALVRFRHPPLEGREDERKALWARMAQVIQRRAPHLVVLTGPQGIGRTRLATAIGEELEASGFGRWGLARFTEPDLSALEQLWGEAPSSGALRRWRRDRPAVIVLDDAEHAPEALLCNFILQNPQPVLWVATSPELPRDLVKRLPEDSWSELRLGPLSSGAMTRLARFVLRLQPRTQATLVEAAAGLPGLLVETIDDWIAEGRLAPTSRGYELQQGRRRTDALPVESRHALELLAIAGGRLPVRTWTEACQAAGLGLVWSELVGLVRQRRARLMLDDAGAEVFELHPGHGWEVLAERAIADQRVSAGCLALSAELLPDDRRQGLLLLGAGRIEAAVDALIHAAQLAHDRDDPARGVVLAARALSVLQAQPDPNPERLWEARLEKAEHLANAWRYAEAMALLKQTRADLPRATPKQRARYWRRLANIFKIRGDGEHLRECVDRTVAIVNRHELSGTAKSQALQACADELITVGEIDYAEELVTQAHEADDSPQRRGYTHLTLARIASFRGDTASARHHIQAGLDCTNRANALACTLYMMLGETLAREGDHEHAAEALQHAREINDQLDRSPLVLVDVNLAALALHQRDWTRAVALCQGLEHDPRVTSLPFANAAVHTMLVVAAAGLQRWDRFREYAPRLEALLGAYPDLRDPDFVAFGALAVELCAAGPEDVRNAARALHQRLEGHRGS